VQLLAHLALPSLAHWLFGHVLPVEVLQSPLPLQTDAVVILPLVQIAAAQTVVLSGKVQVLPSEPSHWAWQAPVPPQGVRGLSGLPLMALHLPTEPASSHDSHWPSQALSQHTPSTQYPVEHSAADLQVAGAVPPVSPVPPVPMGASSAASSPPPVVSPALPGRASTSEDPPPWPPDPPLDWVEDLASVGDLRPV
jgi:hypothetical protein